MNAQVQKLQLLVKQARVRVREFLFLFAVVVRRDRVEARERDAAVPVREPNLPGETSP